MSIEHTSRASSPVEEMSGTPKQDLYALTLQVHKSDCNVEGNHFPFSLANQVETNSPN